MDNESNQQDQQQDTQQSSAPPPQASAEGQPAPGGAPNQQQRRGRGNWRRRRRNGKGGRPSGGGGQSQGRQNNGQPDYNLRQPDSNGHNPGNGNGGGGFQRQNRGGRQQGRQGGRNQRFGGRRFGRSGGAGGGGNFQQQNRGNYGQTQRPSDFAFTEMQPVAVSADAPMKIYVFLDDLFFTTKIQETAKILGVKVGFVKTFDELMAKVEENNATVPALIIFDLNANTTKPLTVIPKVKTKFKKETSVLGFVSHLDGELKLKAQEAGCDTVMPRSGFSQNLANLLRRYAEEEVLDERQPEGI